MSRNATTIEDYDLVVTRDGLTLRINLADVLDGSGDDVRMRVAEMVTWGPVMREACRRLAGTSESWDSDDWRTRAEFLNAVREQAMSDARTERVIAEGLRVSKLTMFCKVIELARSIRAQADWRELGPAEHRVADTLTSIAYARSEAADHTTSALALCQ